MRNYDENKEKLPFVTRLQTAILYDETIVKLMSGILDMKRFVVEANEPLYVRDEVQEIMRRIEKLDEYMSYGTDSKLFKEMVEVNNK